MFNKHRIGLFQRSLTVGYESDGKYTQIEIINSSKKIPEKNISKRERESARYIFVDGRSVDDEM